MFYAYIEIYQNHTNNYVIVFTIAHELIIYRNEKTMNWKSLSSGDAVDIGYEYVFENYIL